MAQITPITCPFCSLHCSDLDMTADPGRQFAIQPGCSMAVVGYRMAFQAMQSDITLSAMAGQEQACHRVAAVLRTVSQPLILISGEMTQEAVRAAIRFGRRIGAIILPAEEDRLTAYALAVKSAGVVTATLGELRRNDGGVVLLGSDPADCLPRFWEWIGQPR